MIQLVSKELRQLIPFAVLWLGLALLFYGVELATVRVDEQSYPAWCDSFCDVGADYRVLILPVVFFLIAAYSLFPREYDDYTIDFLRSLPIGRPTVFVSKFIAVWLLLIVLLIFDRALQALLLSTNTQSITGKMYWEIDLTFLLRDVLFAFVIVSHGIFLSWFRTAGLVLYCGYFIGLVWLEQVKGTSGVYNLFRFYNNEYNGQTLVVDWEVILFHLVIAAILLTIAYFLWTRTDSKPKNSSTRASSKIIPVVFSVLSFLFVAIWMLSLMLAASIDAEKENIQTLNTSNYTFSYRADDALEVTELVKTADQDYQDLADLLGVQNKPNILTDMTSESEHALGLASWKKIKMVVGVDSDSGPMPRRVLSHETAHVFQSVESDRALGQSGNSTGFFIEGMAQYTSFEIVPDVLARETNWIISSVAWQRQEIKFRELTNRRAFESLYDPEMLYGIGDIWTAAMVEACGIESLGEFLRAVGRDDAPPDLTGLGFWRNHLQYIGCELESINNQWRKMMRDIVDTRDTGAFPTFSNVEVSRGSLDNLISIRADLEPGASGLLPQYYYIRVQNETKVATTVSPVLSGELVRDGESATVEFSVLESNIDGTRFRFQLGFAPFPESRNYFDQWRSGTVPE